MTRLDLVTHRPWSEIGSRLGMLAATASLCSLTITHLSAQQEQPDRADSAAAMSMIQASDRLTAEASASRETLERAILLLHQAVALARHGSARTPEMSALYRISYHYRSMGVSDSALKYGKELVVVARSHGSRVDEATGLFALEQVYGYMGRIDSLTQLGYEAMKICIEVGGCWFQYQQFAFEAGWLYQDSSDVGMFRGLASRAQAQGDTVGVARLYDAIGSIFAERLQEYDSALVYYRKVQQMKRPVQETIFGLGRAFRGLGMLDSAWFYFTFSLFVARQRGDLHMEAYDLAYLGRICHRDMKPPLLGCAHAYYDSAASVASQLLRQAGQDMNRVAYGEQATELYSEWALAWLSAADTIGEEAATLGALAVVELGRSATLRDLMLGQRTRDRQPQLGTGGAAAGRFLVNTLPAGGATLSYLIQADTVLAWLTLPTREVRVYRRPISFDSLAARVSALRSALGADDAVAGSRLRGIARGKHSRRSADRARFNDMASGLARLLIPEDLGTLLPPGTDLDLVPQGILNVVPFATLPMTNGEVFGERYAIRYTPSLRTLTRVDTIAALASRSAGGRATALVISDPAMPVAEIENGVRIRLSQLPAADSEGAWVAARLGARWLRGALATESEVRREIPHYDIIHFATHALAYAYQRQARNSFLALTPDSTEDGLLTVGELMDDSTLSVHAKLVVLSACQTAMGSVTQAEGTVGLQRAFLARGAQSLLVSLWSVDDEATEMLMKSFYSHWLGDRDSPTKAEALRRAQRDIRMTARFADPLYWAAFQLVGAN
jgi:tetratricopeptide (TPR) repeat protein